MVDIDEIGKYKKYTKSNVSKAKSKSKHKHTYSNGIVIINDKYNSVYKVKYCTECGKMLIQEEHNRRIEKSKRKFL